MGKREIVGFCQKLANLATNLAQTKANGKPRARYSIRAPRLTKIYLADSSATTAFSGLPLLTV